MDNKRPGCLTTSGFLAGILTILIVGAVGLLGGGVLFSPGQLNARTSATVGAYPDQANLTLKSQLAPLHPVTLGGVTSHAGLSNKCSGCHTGFWENASMADRCVVCHTDINAQKQDPATLHGNLKKNNPDLVCRNCHPDHKGAQAPLTDFKKVNLAHDAFGFATTAHKQRSDGTPFQCSDCHGQNYLKVDQAVCANCHQQLNAAFMPAHLQAHGTDCLACHDGIDTYGHNFNHNKVTFRLTGLHAQVTCEKCHPSAQTLAALRTTPADCASCHKPDDPHSERLGTDCAGCHQTAGWTPASFDHKLAAFQLQGKHTSVACESCHVNNVYKGTPTDCVACHTPDDQHNGQLGTDCAQCHNSVDWKPAHFDHSAFKLTGKHIDIACTACHVSKIIKGTPTDCAACHAKSNPHSSLLGSACASCHTTAGWQPATFDHNLAAYKLTGKHIQAACTDCHANNVYRGTSSNCYACHKKDDKHNGLYGANCALCHSSSGWLPASFDHSHFPLTGKHATAACTSCHTNNIFKGTPSACNSCHSNKNPHSSRLGTSCNNCHTTSAWLPATFDHNLAAFKLTGKHVQAACTSCHLNNVYKGTPATCYACHKSDDKHNGQFGTNCALCHASSGWTPASFDHTNFPLTGKHANAACSSCHVNNVFKGTPKDCNSCHSGKNPHSSLLGSNCGNCHKTSGWLPATFDHSLAAFKLTGAHSSAACTSCHVNNVYKGTPSDCYSCHKQNDNHNGQFGTGCNSCHTTSAWKPATFDHNSSGFKLTGAHAQASCSSCHANNVFKGTPTSCNACHQDQHNGQYGTNCGSCHTTSAWKPANFDHSGFPLTNGHAGLTCNSCHSSGKYTGLSKDCSTCHSEPAYHAGLFSSNCAQCHTTSNWNATYTGSHPKTCDGSCINHHKATCHDCHTVNLSSATCTKCHSKTPEGG